MVRGVCVWGGGRGGNWFNLTAMSHNALSRARRGGLRGGGVWRGGTSQYTCNKWTASTHGNKHKFRPTTTNTGVKFAPTGRLTSRVEVSKDRRDSHHVSSEAGMRTRVTPPAT